MGELGRMSWGELIRWVNWVYMGCMGWIDSVGELGIHGLEDLFGWRIGYTWVGVD